MYCFTCINGINCVLNELMLWTDISSEHPIFVKTVAELSKKNLPPSIVNELMQLNRAFTDLNKRAKSLQGMMAQNPNLMRQYIMQLDRLINEFIVLDRRAIQVYPQVSAYGKDDKTFQTLLNHIEHEQRFMLETFNNIRTQLVR